MSRIRFAGTLLTPSLASATLCGGLGLLILLISSLIYNSRNNVLYNLLFGPDSSAELIQSGKGSIGAINDAVFGNPILNKIIFFVFWCLVGLVIYFLISGIGKTTAVVAETTHQFHYLNAKKQQIEEQLGLRIMMRSMGVLAAFLYGIFFFTVLFPFSILCGRIGISILGLGGWLYFMAGLIVLVLSLHIWIVLLRFISLRPRLYGGWEDVLEGEIADKYREDAYPLDPIEE